ncbi:MAG: CoA-binding domain protein [Frankiales bacterium]|nr:CoA-binding domain protein [Frankiales bacterium]
MTLPLDVSGRPLALRELDWDRLYRPRTVAVIGATDTAGPPRNQWVQVRDRLGARGATVVPVHPKKTDVLGSRAYPSVLDVPGDVDVAVILVRDPLPALQDCLEKGVLFAFVFSAGFSEVGTEEGRSAEARLKQIASGAMRVIGPNTNLNFYEPWRQDLPGRKLAVVTQSGFQGRPLVQGEVLGIPVHTWATVGNEADIEWSDMVAHLVSEPDVGAVASYVEGFVDGRTFMLAADAAARAGKPIVCIKVGRSEEGRVMAQAHTGHLTGSDAVHDAVFEQFGVLRVDDIDEVVEIAGMFCHLRELPASGRVAVYAMSGGTASHVADLCGVAGVPLPTFAPETVAKLEDLLPWYLRKDNPVDSGGVITATPQNIEVLRAMLADPSVDVLFAPITGVFPGMSDALARDLITLHQEGGKPVVACWNSPLRDNDAYRALCAAGVPLFHSMSASVKGLKALGDWSAFTAGYRSPFDAAPRAASPARDAVRGLLGRGALNEVDSKRLLAAYDIPTVIEHVALSEEEAVRAAQALGLPVVLKVLSADIAHKSDLGLVVVGVQTEQDVRDTYRSLVERAAAAAPEARVDGVVVQAMVSGSVAEAIVGLSHQHPFGPTLLVGLGGVLAEVYADVAHLVPPFDEDRVRAVVGGLRAAKLLEGVRGRPAGDIDALVRVVMSLQRLALEIGDELLEIDINPLLVLPEGQGVVAVDALVIGH